MTLNDIFAAIGVVINGIPQALLAMAYGFLAFPTGLGFLLGAVACFVLQSAIPISMQAETIVLAGTMGRNLRERVSMIFFAGAIMAICGITGLLSFVVNLAGERAINGMMAGVGIILARIAFMGFREKPRITGVSSLTAILTYFLSNQNLVYTIVVSVVISSIYANFAKEVDSNVNIDNSRKLKLVKPIVNSQVIRGSLALSCLTIGANIAFGNITASLGNASTNVDHLTIYSGLADMISSIFGGAPVESIISATGAAPNPINSGILMMIIMAAIMFLGLLPKIGKFVPGESIYGFLLVLGALVTAPSNASLAFAGATGIEVLLAGVPMAVTACTDPFYGLLAGILIKIFLI